ncbi:Uncharacterised protein [Legionella pneumophila]|nr:Uncharacterised protein [Legionella pneumophila]
MMNSVMRWSIKYFFKPTHFPNGFSMNPELIDGIDRGDNDKHPGWKTNQSQGQIKHPGS